MHILQIFSQLWSVFYSLEDSVMWRVQPPSLRAAWSCCALLMGAPDYKLSPVQKPLHMLGMDTYPGYMHTPCLGYQYPRNGPQSPRNPHWTCQQSPHTCNKNINKLELSWKYYSNSEYSIFQWLICVASLRNHLLNILWPISKEIAPRKKLPPTHRFPWYILSSNNFVN
jgi:hypothetical protein